MIMDNLKDSGVTIEDQDLAAQLIRLRILNFTNEERVKYLEPYLKTKIGLGLQKNEDIFRVLGPVNPLMDSSYEELEYGGERMFTCNIYDYDPVDGQQIDWYTGSCEQCTKQLRRRWHAVRMPRPHGGWKGCFCSWKCVRDQLLLFPKPEIITDLMINLFEKQINSIKVFDRQKLKESVKFERSDELVPLTYGPDGTFTTSETPKFNLPAFPVIKQTVSIDDI